MILVDQFADELVDFFAIEVRRIFCLLEKESGRILKFFHINLKYKLLKWIVIYWKGLSTNHELKYDRFIIS